MRACIHCFGSSELLIKLMASPLHEEGSVGLSCRPEKKSMASASPLSSSSVPFKWEESPGRPISSCNEFITPDPSSAPSLQLPPKLQFQARQYQYHSSGAAAWQKSPLRSMPPRNQKLMNLCKCMFRTASWSQPLHPQWSFAKRQAPDGSLNDDDPGQVAINDRFFFDKTNPHDLKCSVSIDSWQPIIPLYEEKEDEFACRDSSLVPDDEESTSSSPWHPIMFNEREGSSSPCLPIIFHEREGASSPCLPIIFHDREGASSPRKPIMVREREEDDDGFEFYSTASSIEKPSQNGPLVNDNEPPSPCSWFLDFGPDEEDGHGNKGGSNKIVTLVALIRFKNIISKVCKLNRKREANQADMWSPTLATYLYNQQKQKEEESSLHSIGSPYHSEDEQEDEHTRGQLSRARSPYLSEEEKDEPQKSTFKLSLSEHLAEEEKDEPKRATHKLSLSEHLGYNDLFSEKMDSSWVGKSSIDTKERMPACKGICKVRKTVQDLVATVKLILVQKDARGRRVTSLNFRCRPKFNLFPSSSRLDPTPP